MMMPFQVLMLSNYLVLDRMGLLDTLAGIVLPAIFSTFPVFIMYRFFESVPDSLLEAARLDGAGYSIYETLFESNRGYREKTGRAIPYGKQSHRDLYGRKSERLDSGSVV